MPYRHARSLATSRSPFDAVRTGKHYCESQSIQLPRAPQLKNDQQVFQVSIQGVSSLEPAKAKGLLWRSGAIGQLNYAEFGRGAALLV